MTKWHKFITNSENNQSIDITEASNLINKKKFLDTRKRQNIETVLHQLVGLGNIEIKKDQKSNEYDNIKQLSHMDQCLTSSHTDSTGTTHL